MLLLFSDLKQTGGASLKVHIARSELQPDASINCHGDCLLLPLDAAFPAAHARGKADFKAGDQSGHSRMQLHQHRRSICLYRGSTEGSLGAGLLGMLFWTDLSSAWYLTADIQFAHDGPGNPLEYELIWLE